MGVKTRREYLQRIDAAGSEIWIGCKRFAGRMSEHPAFRGSG